MKLIRIISLIPLASGCYVGKEDARYEFRREYKLS